MHKILIVDDERDLVKGLAMNFRREGYQIIEAYDGRTALNLARTENPHLILLDVMMPGMSGIDVCHALRMKEIDTRIIMLSAKGDEIDKVLGLEIGADDYIAKPFAIRELLALVRARLRYRAPAACGFISSYKFGDTTLDFDKLRATRGDCELDLTPREFDVLHYLIQHRGQTVTRDRILDKIWGSSTYVTPRTVDNHILRLRKKIEPVPSAPQYLLSVYSGGYKFVG